MEPNVTSGVWESLSTTVGQSQMEEIKKIIGQPLIQENSVI